MKKRSYIIMIFLSVVLLCTNTYGQNKELSNHQDQTYWNFLRAKLLPPNSDIARYGKDIKVQLLGAPTTGDSLCVKNLVDQLKGLIETVDISVVSKDGNLVLKIDAPTPNGVSLSYRVYCRQKKEIAFKEYHIGFSTLQSQKERDQRITYILIRALTNLQKNPQGDTNIKGSIFEEKDFKNTSFTPADRFLISKIYSNNFWEEFAANYISRRGGLYKSYLMYRYGDQIKTVTWIIGALLGLLMFLLLLRYKIIDIQAKGWKRYIWSGMLIAQCFLIIISVPFLITSSTYLLYFLGWEIVKILLAYQLLFFIAINLFYFIENSVFRGINTLSMRLLIQLIIGILVMYLFMVCTQNLLGQLIFTNNYLKNNFNWQWDIKVQYWFIIFVVAFLRSLFNYVNAKTVQEIREKDVQLARLKELKSTAELQALESRINPHFLYNSLNTVAALAYVDATKTEHMALALSDFFRYAINRKEEPQTTLGKEVEMARVYMDIEKVRFGDRLAFDVEMEEILENIDVPRFLIQPLVENAVKHGISVISGKACIKLQITKKEDCIEIRVYDNGPAFPKDPIPGYGLHSLYEKLNLLYGNKARIVWENEPDKYISIIIPAN